MNPLVMGLAESAARARRSPVAIAAALTAAFAVLAQPARATVYTAKYPAEYTGIVTYIETWHQDWDDGGSNDGNIRETATLTFSDPQAVTEPHGSGLSYKHATGSWTVFVHQRSGGGVGSFGTCAWDGSATSAIHGGLLAINETGKKVGYNWIAQPPLKMTNTCTYETYLPAPQLLDNIWEGGGSSRVGKHVHGTITRPSPYYGHQLLSEPVGVTGVETWNFVASWFTIDEDKQLTIPKKGTATLPVKVSGPGQLGLSGKYVVKQTKSVAAQGTAKLLVKAKGKARKTLDKQGNVKVKVTITFTPKGGTPVSQTKTVRLSEQG